MSDILSRDDVKTKLTETYMMVYYIITFARLIYTSKSLITCTKYFYAHVKELLLLFTNLLCIILGLKGLFSNYTFTQLESLHAV